MINQRIGSFIATLRKEQGLTQEQFAEKLGTTNRSVSRWENGVTLPDISLMQSICRITGVTLSELLSGARTEPSDECRDSILALLSLWDREKLAKKRTLNIWFGLGFAMLSISALTAGIWPLTVLGIFFQCLGFYRNSCDRRLSDGEKAILADTTGRVAMRCPEELLAFARRSQPVNAPQYKAAFREICENLAAHEQVCFAMVANEYAVDSTPGIWHIGVAVTQDRVFLCGETIAGRFMTRTVMNVYDRKDIFSIQCTNGSIVMKIKQARVVIKGKNLGQPGERFKQVLGET